MLTARDSGADAVLAAMRPLFPPETATTAGLDDVEERRAWDPAQRDVPIRTRRRWSAEDSARAKN
jgi:hypothetical protein